MNHGRLSGDYERDQNITKCFIFAANSRLMLRRLALS